MSKPKMYYRFTERNEWEGETWHFYIPADGNEAEVAKLKDRFCRGPVYSVSLSTLLPEHAATPGT